jgi:hypothetical protein
MNVHYAKVDWWLAALLGGTAAVEVGAAALVLALGLTRGDPDLPTALFIAGTLAGSGLLIGVLLWGCYRTRYEISPPDLVVRFGPFGSRLPLDALEEVSPTRNPLSAPAPSLDRLRINYRTQRGALTYALVSPKDKEAFIRDLAAAAPGLRRTGG